MSRPFLNVSLEDDATRLEFKTRIRLLRNHVASGNGREAAETLAGLDDWYRPVAEADLSRLLLQGLTWGEDEHRLCDRLQSTCAMVADLGRQAAVMAADSLGEDDPLIADALARALLAWARACKLEHLGAVPSPRRQRFRELHALYEAAERRGATEITRAFTADGQAMESSIESLYVRALLLARLMGGNLNAQQVEILDNWLLHWMPSMWITAVPPEGEIALVVRLSGNAGLAQGTIAVADDVRYVCVKPLHQRLDQTVSALHQGELFPGWGLATSLRVEDHIVVLDSLQRELAQIEAGGYTQRPRRAQAFGMAVDTQVGVSPVMGSAFDRGGPAIRMRLQDHNETGVGFLVDATHGERIQPGDLIAMSLFPDQPDVLGEVVRKRAGRVDEDVSVGVRLISRDCVPLPMEFEDDTRADNRVDAIFVPGLDRSGRHDAIVVPESAFRAGKILRTSDDGEVFRMSLNRVRHKGRGWVVAGFEMIVSEPDVDGDVVTADAVMAPGAIRAQLELADWPEGRVQ